MMLTLADKLAAAGLISQFEADISGLSLGQLKKRRNNILRAAAKEQGSSYRRNSDGKFRATRSEQEQLLALNKAIRALRK